MVHRGLLNPKFRVQFGDKLTTGASTWPPRGWWSAGGSADGGAHQSSQRLLAARPSGDSQPNSALSPALSPLSGPESARPSGRSTRATLSALSGLTGQAHNCEQRYGAIILERVYLHPLTQSAKRLPGRILQLTFRTHYLTRESAQEFTYMQSVTSVTLANCVIEFSRILLNKTRS